MMDSKLLRDVLRDSGYRLVYVAGACGLTYAGFLKKLNNETEFKASEIMALRRLLQLTDAEINAIFFEAEGHKKAQNWILEEKRKEICRI